MLFSPPPTVWIVDDDEDDQFLLEAALKQLIPSVQVKLLSDGEEVLPALAESETLPGLVIPLQRTVGFKHAQTEWL